MPIPGSQPSTLTTDSNRRNHTQTRRTITNAQEIKAKRDEDLLILPTDAAVFEDEGFRPFAEKYAADQDAFFAVRRASG
jgi:hypothetical protein